MQSTTDKLDLNLYVRLPLAKSIQKDIYRYANLKFQKLVNKINDLIDSIPNLKLKN